MWMMSVPSATCTVTGIPSRCAATSEAAISVRRVRLGEIRADRLTESLPRSPRLD